MNDERDSKVEGTPTARPPTVLCVDDEPMVLRGLRRQLRRVFDVHLAEGATEALHILQECEIDAITSDLRMPEVDGIELLGRVRKLFPRTARLLITGHVDAVRFSETLNPGLVFAVLDKPSTTAELCSTIEAAILDAKTAPESP